jgi:DNA-binding GntR family transcriptional regulator
MDSRQIPAPEIGRSGAGLIIVNGFDQIRRIRSDQPLNPPAGCGTVRNEMAPSPRTRPARTTRPKSTPRLQLLQSAEDSGSGETVQNRAYAALKNAVMEGRFRPGETVTLRALSSLLGTSDMPVREALRRLTSEGAFEALPNRSTRIPRLSRRQVEQIYELRVELEGKAAALAADQISKHQVDELVALQAQLNDCIEHGDMNRFTAINKEFHFRVYAIADNEPMQTLIEMLWLRMGPLVSWIGTLSAESPDHMRKIGQAHHNRLIKALQARDADAACEAMRADLREPTRLAGFWRAIDQLSVGETPKTPHTKSQR